MRRMLVLIAMLALSGCGEGGKQKPTLVFHRPVQVAEVPRPQTGPAPRAPRAATAAAAETPVATAPAQPPAPQIYIVQSAPPAVTTPAAPPPPLAAASAAPLPPPAIPPSPVPAAPVAHPPPPVVALVPAAPPVAAPPPAVPALPPVEMAVPQVPPVAAKPAPPVESKVAPAEGPAVVAPKAAATPAQPPKPAEPPTAPAAAKALPLFSLPASVPDGVITIDGSSTVFPFARIIKREFSERYPNVKISLGGEEQGTMPAGSGGGFKKFTAGETQISNASRFIKPKEIEKAQSNKIEFIELPLAYDGLSVVVNPLNDWAQHLTTAELKAMWEPESRISNWKDVRAGFPDVPIAFYAPGTESGTFDYFTEEIVGKSRTCRKDFTGSEDDEIIVKGVQAHKGGIGFFGMAYFFGHKADLKLVAIDGGHGPVLPSMETVANGTYIPLSRPLFMYVNAEAAKRPDVDAYVKFFINNVARAARQVGYIPFAPESYQLVRQRYEKRIVGSLQTQGTGSVEQLLKAP